MEYRKERQFIVAYDGGVYRGKLDILTNEWYGVNGTRVKTCPKAFCANARNDITDAAIRHLLYVYAEYGRNTFTPEHGKRAEEVLSVGLKIDCGWYAWRFLATDHTKLTKELVQYLNDYHAGCYCENNLNQYKRYTKCQSFLNKCPDHKDWAYRVVSTVSCTVPQFFVEGMVLRAIHEKVYYNTTPVSYASLLEDWCFMINQLGDTLEVQRNILTTYNILRWTYNQWKTSHYDDILKQRNDQAWLYFEDDDYIVRPLLSRTDFHVEATAQHNCVERMYMDFVYEGNTHVVTVRKKSAPDVPYITCEVDKTHIIRQYLFAFNRTVKANTPEYEFYCKYRNFLSTSLNQ